MLIFLKPTMLKQEELDEPSINTKQGICSTGSYLPAIWMQNWGSRYLLVHIDIQHKRQGVGKQSLVCLIALNNHSDVVCW